MYEIGMKKHKKHKTDKREKYEGAFANNEKQPALKLILKVGGSNSTPEHSSDSPCPVPVSSVASSVYSVSGTLDDESRQSAASSLFPTPDGGPHFEKHKKAKKKKKKKDRSKDREKKHKHHHKEKRRRRDESSQDDISIGEDSLNDPPVLKRVGDISSTPVSSLAPRFASVGMLRPGTHPVIPQEQFHLEVPHSVEPGGQQSPGSAIRSPRTCVLRQREQERSPLVKLLDYLLKTLEKRDPQQFFAWPVTDLIAPGYSHIITKPMDFSTMKQKILDNQYNNLPEFFYDFKLMCNNAMEYNHIETIYYKSAKKLLHLGSKILQPEKIRSLRQILPFMVDIPKEELGFDIGVSIGHEDAKMDANFDVEDTANIVGDLSLPANAGEQLAENKRRGRIVNYPSTKFEAIADDMTPEEILAQVQTASKLAKQKLSAKVVEPQLGFLRQRKDGTTTLNLLMSGDGVNRTTNERPISLGSLTGKLTCGTGQLQGFKEDRRNMVKTNKPLCYGAFGSYAPSYDSTFANLSKEESDLVLQTYGDENAVQYAESILDFAKDCDYTLHMVDSLLDIVTGGDHSKTKKILDERKRLREEEETIRQLLEEKASNAEKVRTGDKIDLTNLKTLSKLGIDVGFLDSFEQQFKIAEEQKVLQERLESTSQLLEKLQQVQNDRLSMQPPSHLANVAQPSESEIMLADKITENLTDMAKKMTPADIASLSAVRKAMGISIPTAESKDSPTAMQIDSVTAGGGVATEVPVGDLESELREFLENAGPALSPHSTHLHDPDNTIEDILMD